MFRLFCSIVLFVISLNTVAAQFEQGKDYQLLQITDAQRGESSQSTVLEFFSYGCPWCYKLEAGLNQWLGQQGKKVTFTRIPVVFHADWKYYAKAYFLIKALSLGPTVSQDLFKAILVDKKPLTSNQAMIAFFTQHGVDPSLAKSTFEQAPGIEMQLKEAEAMMVQYQIRGVPAFVVHGKYMTNMQLAKSEERLFEILSFLIKEQ